METWLESMDRLTAGFEDAHPFTSARIGFEPSGAQLDVLVAETAEQRARGLTGRSLTVPLLFVQPSSRDGAFHMAGVDGPLVIAFFAEDGAFLSQAAMSPDGPIVRAGQPFRFALEMSPAIAAQVDVTDQRLVHSPG